MQRRAATVHPGTLEETMTGVVMQDLAGNDEPTRPYGLTIAARVHLRQIISYSSYNPAAAMRLLLQHFGQDRDACAAAIEFLTVEMTR